MWSCIEGAQRDARAASGSVGKSEEAFSRCDRNSNLSDDDDDVEAASCDMGRGDIALSRVWREREMIHGKGWVFSTPARED